MSATTLTLNLSSDIEYVAGTVNGVATVFNQDTVDTTKWWALAETSTDNIYEIFIEAYKATGLHSTYTTTIEYEGLSFIYDRTQEDVDKAVLLHQMRWEDMTESQQNEFKRGLKGAFNSKDIKRIENDIHLIASYLNMSDEVVDYKDNIPEFPTKSYFLGLLGRLDILKTAGYLKADTPATPVMPINTFEKVNTIERILFDIYSTFTSNFNYYAGEGLYAGEETNLLI